MGEKLGETVPALMQKHQIKPVEMLHLDPGHKILWVLDAPSAESVRNMIYEGGLSRWNDFEFYMTSTLEGITAEVRELPTVW